MHRFYVPLISLVLALNSCIAEATNAASGLAEAVVQSARADKLVQIVVMMETAVVPTTFALEVSIVVTSS